MVQHALDGAVALVSGRSLDTLDELFAPSNGQPPAYTGLSGATPPAGSSSVAPPQASWVLLAMHWQDSWG